MTIPENLIEQSDKHVPLMETYSNEILEMALKSIRGDIVNLEAMDRAICIVVANRKNHESVEVS